MPRFSTKTIVDVLPPLMEILTHQEIDELLLRLGLQNIAPNEEPENPGKFFSKKDRAQMLAKYLIENPDIRGCYESNLAFEVLDDIIEKSSGKCDIANQLPIVINSLKRDGYAIQSCRLRTLLPDELDQPKKENRIIELLDKFNFNVAKGHYDQAISAYTRGEWAAANGQLRPFVEELFNSIADKIAERKVPPELLPANSYNKREFLARENFFQANLNEWKIGGGSSFVEGFWLRLHPQGSHPGLSDEDDCTFRLHLVILVTAYFLEKFDSWL